MGGQLDVHHHPRLALIFAVPVREHQFGVGVFMVDDQQAALRVRAPSWQGQESDEIGIIAELPSLYSRLLGAGVEGWGIGEHWVTPADDDVILIAIGDTVLKRVNGLA
jgi:hypothetical protein